MLENICFVDGREREFVNAGDRGIAMRFELLL